MCTNRWRRWRLSSYERLDAACNRHALYPSRRPLLQDQLRSSSSLLTATGALAPGGRAYYTPFGAARAGTLTLTLTSKHFTGQYHEANLTGGAGLYDYGARWYDPRIGRFLSPDSIVPEPGNPQTLNRYSYANNNPVNLSDPSGHAPIPVYDGAGGPPADYNPIDWSELAVSNPSIAQAQMRVWMQDHQVPALLQGMQQWLERTHPNDQIVPQMFADVRFNATMSGDLPELFEHANWQQTAPWLGTMAAAVATTDAHFGERGAADGGGRPLLTLNRRNFRANLIRSGEPLPGNPADFEAHHIFPVALAEQFQGIKGLGSIHDPLYGVWVPKGVHQSWSFDYEAEWRIFFQFPRSLQDVFDQAREMAPYYGYRIRFW